MIASRSDHLSVVEAPGSSGLAAGGFEPAAGDLSFGVAAPSVSGVAVGAVPAGGVPVGGVPAGGAPAGGVPAGGAGAAAGEGAGASTLPRMIGRPSFPPPTMTILLFVD